MPASTFEITEEQKKLILEIFPNSLFENINLNTWEILNQPKIFLPKITDRGYFCFHDVGHGGCLVITPKNQIYSSDKTYIFDDNFVYIKENGFYFKDAKLWNLLTTNYSSCLRIIPLIVHAVIKR